MSVFGSDGSDEPDGFEDPDELEFEDDPWDNGDDWGDLIDPTKDQIIINDDEKKDDNIPININDENPLQEGISIVLPPKIIKKYPRCWVCPCSGINHLESSMKNDFRCVLCNNPYNVKYPVIYTDNYDKIGDNNIEFELDGDRLYEIWRCPHCTVNNDINNTECHVCKGSKPKKKKLKHYRGWVSIKPVSNNKHKNNNIGGWSESDMMKAIEASKALNKKHNVKIRGNRKGRVKNIGIARDILKYPIVKRIEICEERMVKYYGIPYQNKYIIENDVVFGKKNNMFIGNIAGFMCGNSIGDRGFCINEDGYYGVLTNDGIQIYQPINSMVVMLCCQIYFKDVNDIPFERIVGNDFVMSRLRFKENELYLFVFSTKIIYHFKYTKLYYNQRIVYSKTFADNYIRESQTIDIDIRGNLLLTLFDKWVGMFYIKSSLQWYHAIAFAQKDVNVFTFQIINDLDTDNVSLTDDDSEQAIVKQKYSHKNYIYINVENQLIGIHPSTPTFDFIHMAKIGNKSWCVSKQFGTFYVNKNRNAIYQTPTNNPTNLHCILKINEEKNIDPNLNKIEKNGMKNLKIFYIDNNIKSELKRNVKQFINIFYDDLFGISGRLIIIYETKKNTYGIKQIFYGGDILLLKDEINTNKYIKSNEPGIKNDFNLIINIYSMLFGDDIIDELINNDTFNSWLNYIKKQRNELQNIKQNNIIYIDQKEGE